MQNKRAASPFWVLVLVGQVVGQTPPESPPASETEPAEVAVQPVDDSQIQQRLTRILEATRWFEQPQVRVDAGVVFLQGYALQSEYKEWATALASNTEDVVGVVNQMQVVRRPLWDLTPAYEEFQTLRHEAIQSLPIAGAALLIFAFTLLIVRLARRIATVSLRARIRSSLLRQVAANTVGMMVLVLGLFLVFKVSGLTRLATTVLGGTGLVGLVVGIAFRDIAENFLASILISTQRPFQLGDLIEVDGVRGYVQNVTTRGTLLMTVEGNHVQIPNSLIYKNKVFNFTANPNERFSFRIGIDYEDSVSAAQELALATVLENPAVLRDPEPMVLLEELGASTVNLRIYYWVNIREHSGLKVLSSVQRLVKSAFQRAGITMPDAAREIIFPQGVPVRRIDPHATHRPGAPPAASAPGQADDQVVAAEGSLTTDAQVVQSQAKLARLPSAGTSLLEE